MAVLLALTLAIASICQAAPVSDPHHNFYRQTASGPLNRQNQFEVNLPFLRLSGQHNYPYDYRPVNPIVPFQQQQQQRFLLPTRFPFLPTPPLCLPCFNSTWPFNGAGTNQGSSLFPNWMNWWTNPLGFLSPQNPVPQFPTFPNWPNILCCNSTNNNSSTTTTTTTTAVPPTTNKPATTTTSTLCLPCFNSTWPFNGAGTNQGSSLFPNWMNWWTNPWGFLSPQNPVPQFPNWPNFLCCNSNNNSSTTTTTVAPTTTNSPSTTTAAPTTNTVGSTTTNPTTTTTATVIPSTTTTTAIPPTTTTTAIPPTTTTTVIPPTTTTTVIPPTTTTTVIPPTTTTTVIPPTTVPNINKI